MGTIRHTLAHPPAGTLGSRSSDAQAPEPVLHVHPTGYRYAGDADPSAPGGIATIYRDLIADDARTGQITDDVVAALARGRHCPVLTQWTEHLNRLVTTLSERGHEPVVLRGGIGPRPEPPPWPGYPPARRAAAARRRHRALHR